ncbi:MAG: hypothetical protein C0603_03830 [Denitrovibrio sp.]|nr:MAG: hypothetical protein C0603_03830 [Denitrovibrio sp.]
MNRIISVITILLVFFLSNVALAFDTNKVIRVAVHEEFPPYMFVEDGKPQGFAVDFFSKFAERYNLKLSFVQYKTWNDIFADRDKDVYDIIPNQGITKERQKLFLFGNPYETFHISAFTRMSSISKPALKDYVDNKVGVLINNVGVKIAKKNGLNNTIKYETLQSLLFGLLAADVDLIIMSEPVLLKEAEFLNITDKLKITFENLMEIKRSVAVTNNNTDLGDFLFPKIDSFVRTQEYRDIYISWFSNTHNKDELKKSIKKISLVFSSLLFFVILAAIYIRVRDTRRHTAMLKDKVIELETTKNALDEMNQNLESIVNEKSKSLADAKERLQLAIEASSTGIWDWDIENDNIFFSKMWKSILGYEEHEINNSFEEFSSRLHPEDKEKHLKDIKDFLQNPSGHFTKTFRMKAKDGTYRWIMNRSSFQLNEDGKIKSMFGSHQDITEIKEYEEKLSVNLKTLTTVLNAFPEILYISDIDTYEIIFANSSFVKMLESDPIGKKCYKAIQNLDEPCSFCTNEIILANEGPYIWEHYNESIDTHFYVNDQVIEWVDGRKVRFEMAVNMNRMKEIEQQLTKSNQELEKMNLTLDKKVHARTKLLETANKELESFAYTVSHDLRAPLRHINGFIDILKSELDDDITEKAIHSLYVITQSSLKMGNLIDDLLKFSRLNQAVINRIKLSPKELIDDIISEYNDEIVDLGVKFEIDIKSDIYVDRGLFRQVFANLISNAIKYSSKSENPVVKIRTYTLDNYAIIEVEDNGIGFDMQYAGKIFGVFERLTNSSEYSGMGIGLATVNRIVHRHEGLIEAYGELNKGAKFTIHIPATGE